MKAIRPTTPGDTSAPHGPGPSPNRSAVVSPSVRRGQHAVDERVFLFVRDDGRRTGQRRDLVSRAGGVAPGGDHTRIGVEPCDPAQHLPGAMIRRGGHRAGVDDDQVRFLHRRASTPARPQSHLDLHGIGLVHTAPERRDGVTHWFLPYRRQGTTGQCALAEAALDPPKIAAMGLAASEGWEAQDAGSAAVASAKAGRSRRSLFTSHAGAATLPRTSRSTMVNGGSRTAAVWG